MVCLQSQHRKAGAEKPVDSSRTDISRSPDDDQIRGFVFSDNLSIILSINLFIVVLSAVLHTRRTCLILFHLCHQHHRAVI